MLIRLTHISHFPPHFAKHDSFFPPFRLYMYKTRPVHNVQAG